VARILQLFYLDLILNRRYSYIFAKGKTWFGCDSKSVLGGVWSSYVLRMGPQLRRLQVMQHGAEAERRWCTVSDNWVEPGLARVRLWDKEARLGDWVGDGPD
jgi:hypothetical protein